MNRLETITTKVRPIKKLFIIEPQDQKGFESIVRTISTEIRGLSNLVLLNDDTLFSKNTLQFINRHDPDVIINYSSCQENRLRRHFRTCVYNTTDYEFAGKHLSTPLSIWSAVPQVFRRWMTDEKPSVYSTHDIKHTPLGYLYSLHYGTVEQDYSENDELSLFHGVKIKTFASLKEFFHQFFERHENNFLHLTSSFSISSGNGTSIWEVDYNREQFFDDKPTLIIGEWSDLRSITYFWNMRATYPYNKTLWLPIELWHKSHRQVISKYLDRFAYICRFHEDSAFEDNLKNLQNGVQEIDCSRYYFRSYEDGWKSFEHTQVVPVVENSLRVTHPSERLFSNDGFNINLVLEVRGLESAILPNSSALGELFVPNPDKRAFPQYFRRIGKRGLSCFVDGFDPLRDNPIYEEIRLPNDEQVFEALFAEFGFKIKATSETKLAKQIISLIGGIDNIAPLCNPQMAKLLVELTPQRVERIARELRKNIETGLSDSDLLDLLTSNLNGVLMRNTDLIVDAETMIAKCQIGKVEKPLFLEKLQWLNEVGIMLRGKCFPCSHCGTRLWLALDTIQSHNRCYACNCAVQIPIHEGEKLLGDNFRLNELMCSAVDQGVLPLLFAIQLIGSQKYYGTRLLYNYDIYSETNTKVAEIDLMFTLGKRLGLAEIKADRGFEEPQLERFLQIATQMNVDLLLFGTLRHKESEDVKNLISFLKGKSLEIPAFIATRETLLEERRCNMYKYFETDHFANKFRVGPILLEHTENVLLADN